MPQFKWKLNYISLRIFLLIWYGITLTKSANSSKSMSHQISHIANTVNLIYIILKKYNSTS